MKKPPKGSRHKWKEDLNDEMPGRKKDGESTNSASPGSGLQNSGGSPDASSRKSGQGGQWEVDRQHPIHNWNALGEDMIR